MKQAYLTLDGWMFLPVAYLSIIDEPEVCKQLVLSFAGKFISTAIDHSLGWIDTESLRFARGIMRPFTSVELASHLQRSDRQARRILDKLVSMNMLVVINDKQRYRNYQLLTDSVKAYSNGHP
ncbi:hypothetical protein GCM10010916_13790 [Paenibacillus abyssi]|uniref:Uncharacterized protein n=2 Tax=Paenibacillus abyssi TaxID=1340531 RepID=A0A917CTK5_9BACL|nr:hypothetical protein GCM10010916_13790 [Paenibacillus abyssi]